MAKNDIVLLDSFVDKARIRFELNEDSELFELFSFEQILKQYEPSFDELEAGWTDGGNDGGIDGLFIYVDQQPATPDTANVALRRNPIVDVYIISCRRSAKFEQQPIDSLASSLAEILDFRIDDGKLSYPYNEYIIQQRSLLRNTYIELGDRAPKLSINMIYCSRGDTAELAPNLKARSENLTNLVKDLFGDAQVAFRFIGASELLTLAREGFDFRMKLPFTELPISREGRNFVLLSTLSNYYRSIVDENGSLKRYLFESNVRDYLGNVQVNADISVTLARKDLPDQGDFWWLNNGVTILATKAWVMAKEIFAENAQIVNGLQTTETIYNYFSRLDMKDDNRAILIKIIVAADDDIRARIVKATNYQNTIDLSHLRGLDKIQKDIDQFLFDNGWFYDRRKNYYKNLGKPAGRIITIPYLAAAVRAIALGDPSSSRRQRARSLRDNNTYNAVFDTKWDLRVYLTCVQLARAIEGVTHAKRNVWDSPPMAFTHFVGFVYVCEELGKVRYRPEEIVELSNKVPSEARIQKIRDDLENASRETASDGRKFKGVLLSKEFIDWYVHDRVMRSSSTL